MRDERLKTGHLPPGGTTVRAIALACVFALFSTLATETFGARPAKKQLWGAVAYNSKTGAYGYAVDVKSKRDAESEAFRQCGGDCDELRSFRNACGALAQNERRFTWMLGATRQVAEQKALRKCAVETCEIIVWACTSEK